MSNLQALGRKIDSALKFVSLTAGGIALAGMTGLSVFNVLIMRKALNSPIQGAEDILILALVFIVAVSIPFGARTGAHIEIEMLEPYMSPLVSRVSLILMKLIGLGFLSIMAWRLYASGTQATRFGETTLQLLISFEPFYYLLAVAIGTYAVIKAVEIVLLTTGHDLEKPGASGDVPRSA